MVPIVAVAVVATIALVMVVATVMIGVGMMRIDDAAAQGRDGDRHGDEEQATFHGRDLQSVRASHSHPPCPGKANGSIENTSLPRERWAPVNESRAIPS